MPPSLIHLGLIAGKGSYPVLLAKAARAAGVQRLSLVAFDAETDPSLHALADEATTLRVGQLGALLSFFKEHGVKKAVMAGQITPGRLFDLKPDLKAFLLLAKLKQRNAETIFGAVADELAKGGTELLPATTFMEDSLAPTGHFGGPKPKRQITEDTAFGFQIAKEMARLDVGQSVVVKRGTVLAVEAFEGTDAALKRGGELGRSGSTLVKVSKANQDFRFDVPVIGPRTLEGAIASGIAAIGCEAGRTLLLDRERVLALAAEGKVALIGL
ncbi:hypothetical protein SAMN05444156_2393 [Verrucomicrobium sp. GAS474]|uniref:LpxI family protein n=1 Tax=Verrucomicrobium sp. GAS474 TaxID=1882831 RepID=UPI000879CB28|nr:UDP-2,3-diacylglucosamine diphosphatase LpxI [Verrucomicrobium sp. GAS474]SDU17149.1 hypothetical protein SAMN05444156_2393 [Verrucomicrobium sp. GAS474]